MQSEALYQKYRSQTFDEVVGQEYVVRSVKNAVHSGKVGHAYLFCGPRGTGKTTMARLLARAVNCENPAEAPCGHCENCRAALEGNHPDIIEINAANETHVEDIRDLIERARLAPMLGRHKIYIIDEVHQLSSSAASALLKTLEEPPEHIIFILATTDPQKLLSTIISRCQRFDFGKVSAVQIRDHLLHIAGEEGFALDLPAAEKIAALADGGMRDALSMLEQASAYGNGIIREEDVDEIYGLASTAEKMELLEAVFTGDLASILERTEAYEAKGLDLKRLTSDLVNALKDALVWMYTGKETLLRTLTAELAASLSEKATERTMLGMIDILMKASESYKNAQSVASVFEVTCLKLVADRKAPEPRTAAAPEKIAVPPTPISVISEPEVQSVEETEEHISAQPAAVPEREKTDLVELLVQCDKDSKTADTEIFRRITGGLLMDKYAAALKQTELKASGKDCIVLTSSSRVVVHTINETEMNTGLYFYLQEAGMDKMPFAYTEAEYQDAVRNFVEMRKNNTLPTPLKVERYIKQEEEKGEAQGTEERLRNLLGDDLFQVYE